MKLVADKIDHHSRMVGRFNKYRSNGYPDIDNGLSVLMDKIDPNLGLVPVWSCIGHNVESVDSAYITFSTLDDLLMIELYDDLIGEFDVTIVAGKPRFSNLIRSYLNSPFSRLYELEQNEMETVYYPVWTIEFKLFPEQRNDWIEALQKVLERRKLRLLQEK